MNYTPEEIEKAMSVLNNKRASMEKARSIWFARFKTDKEKSDYYKSISQKAAAKRKLRKQVSS